MDMLTDMIPLLGCKIKNKRILAVFYVDFIIVKMRRNKSNMQERDQSLLSSLVISISVSHKIGVHLDFFYCLFSSDRKSVV